MSFIEHSLFWQSYTFLLKKLSIGLRNTQYAHKSLLKRHVYRAVSAFFTPSYNIKIKFLWMKKRDGKDKNKYKLSQNQKLKTLLLDKAGTGFEF